MRRWLRQGYMVPEELPALYMTPEDEAGALMEDGTGEAEPGEAPHAGGVRGCALRRENAYFLA